MVSKQLKSHLALFRNADHAKKGKDPESLCQESTSYQPRMRAIAFENELEQDNEAILCERCVFLARIAQANNISLQHFRLDQLVNEILRKAAP